jgi:hypothetical protein
LDAHAIKYGISKIGNRVVLELPADIGYATLLFTLLTYNVRNPERYSIFLEKLLAGRIPLSKHLGVFIDIAVGLRGTELEFVIMVIAVSCVKLLSAHNSTQHTSRKHKV